MDSCLHSIRKYGTLTKLLHLKKQDINTYLTGW